MYLKLKQRAQYPNRIHSRNPCAAVFALRQTEVSVVMRVCGRWAVDRDLGVGGGCGEEGRAWKREEMHSCPGNQELGVLRVRICVCVCVCACIDKQRD